MNGKSLGIMIASISGIMTFINMGMHVHSFLNKYLVMTLSKVLGSRSCSRWLDQSNEQNR